MGMFASAVILLHSSASPVACALQQDNSMALLGRNYLFSFGVTDRQGQVVQAPTA